MRTDRAAPSARARRRPRTALPLPLAPRSCGAVAAGPRSAERDAAPPLACPARRRLLPSPRTVTRPGCGGAGRSVPAATCSPARGRSRAGRPELRVPAGGGEARRDERRKRRDRSRRRPRPPRRSCLPLPRALFTAAAARSGARAGKQHRPARCASGAARRCLRLHPAALRQRPLRAQRQGPVPLPGPGQRGPVPAPSAPRPGERPVPAPVSGADPRGPLGYSPPPGRAELRRERRGRGAAGGRGSGGGSAGARGLCGGRRAASPAG